MAKIQDYDGKARVFHSYFVDLILGQTRETLVTEQFQENQCCDRTHEIHLNSFLTGPCVDGGDCRDNSVELKFWDEFRGVQVSIGGKD